MSVLVGRLIKIVRSAVVAAVSLLIVGAIVAPSQAAMDPNCSLNNTTPTDDNTRVYITSYVSCQTYMGYTAVEVRGKIQEKVGPVWTSRTSDKTRYSAGTTYLSVDSSFVCNGHGTDWWRGYNYGKTSDGGSTSKSGRSAQLTC